MTTYLFPGQGSQHVGMGKPLFERFPELTSRASEILGYSIAELCLENARGLLDDTQYTQPALYVVNALTYFAELEDTGRKPDWVAGHSLGEYDALLAAGVLDFETGLRLVRRRGELMAQARGGGMAAVIGVDAAVVERALRDAGLAGLDVANYNSPQQVVLSGPLEEIDRAQPALEAAGARYVKLKVSAAFHSRYMQPARDAFAEFVRDVRFRAPSIPVIANVTARPYPDSADGIAALLTSQIVSSVRWTDSIRRLLGRGETVFKELGPKRVLTGLVKQIEPIGPLADDDPAPPAPRAAAMAERSTATHEGSTATREGSTATSARSAASSAKVANASSTRVAVSETAARLGSAAFRDDYGASLAYVAGSMHAGVASPRLVATMARARLLSFLGTAGMPIRDVEDALSDLRRQLDQGEPWGAALTASMVTPDEEERLVDAFLRHGVRNVEASGYIQLSPALVRFHVAGLRRGASGKVESAHRILAKVSRPEVAAAFLGPAPERVLAKLVAAGKIREEEAALAKEIPVASDLCAEADCGGYTDQAAAYAVLPTIARLRDEAAAQLPAAARVRVGAAGGLGTPEAIAAAFVLGADFVLTGSINQCTVEAATSDLVKDMLQDSRVQDMAYAPAADMFDVGGRIQVLRKGVFFHARAAKLHSLYQQYGSLEELDAKTRAHLEEKIFGKRLDEVWSEVRQYWATRNPDELARAERNPKQRMHLVFRWYYKTTLELALVGNPEQKVHFQVHCGSAMGAFNAWAKGTAIESWRHRHVDAIAHALMDAAARLMADRYAALLGLGGEAAARAPVSKRPAAPHENGAPAR